LEELNTFGAAGIFLSLPEARALLDAIRASAKFRRYRKQHAPRLKDAHEVHVLVQEFAVRMFCALDLRNVTAEPESILQILIFCIRAMNSRDPLQKMAAFIPGSRSHAYPAERLYKDYRRLLLKLPLGEDSHSPLTPGFNSRALRKRCLCSIPRSTAPAPAA